MAKQPKITAKQEGGDDGFCYVVRVNGKAFVSGLSRREVPHYKAQALKAWEAKNNPEASATAAAH